MKAGDTEPSAAKKPAGRGPRLPILQGILPLDRSRIPTEVVAGVTLAALGIPEVMGYAGLAGMPVITGLYTLVLPVTVFALLGSSRHLVVGADSATAVMLAAGLAGIATPGSAEYIGLASILAIMAAGFLILARLIRLGFLADFLSRSVLIGFLTGVGIQVAMGQLAGMLGVPGGTGGTLSKFWGTIEQIPDTSLTTLAVSLSVIAIIVGTKIWAKKIPGALIAVVGSIIVSSAFDLASHGVSTLGKVPSGLPKFAWPSGWDKWQDLLPTAASIFLVILAQSAATSRAYAAKYRDRFDENTDLVGLGMANVAAGISGTFVVNGSPTKTQMVDSAGGRSQVAQISTAVIVVVVLLFLTKPLQYLPNAVLASVVFIIGVELIDILGMRRILRWRVDEFVIAAVTAATVVIVGVEQGILLAIVLSVIDHLRRGYHPRDTLLVQGPEGTIHSAPVPESGPAPVLEPGLVVYRFGASMYYANSNRFVEEVREIVHGSTPPPAWLCIDSSGVGDVDFSAGETLLDLQAELADGGVRLVFADVHSDVRKHLDRYGVTERVGEDGFFDSIASTVRAFRARGA
jgi:high affinity sulfate transporter 1